MTLLEANVSFSFTRDTSGDIALSRAEKLRVDLRRRDFLVRFCQGAGAALIPSGLWCFGAAEFAVASDRSFSAAGFQLHPHYRNERPLDATILKVQPGLDDFITEKFADQIAAILEGWKSSLLGSPDVQRLADALSSDFLGASLQPVESRVVRSGSSLEVHQNKFSAQALLSREAFLRALQSYLTALSKIITAEFQITAIDAGDIAPTASQLPSRVQTRIHYEIVGTGNGFYREQRVGQWDVTWVPSASGEFHVHKWQALEETQARSQVLFYADISASALGANSSYSAQLLHGTDYWRTILDGACGIDIYGHNGVSVADIDNDGFDDLYVCQPAGLPNRLYRNRGDGTFEDITESSGLGILDNTACVLFADFDNRGRQDVVLVRGNGPTLFLNEGNGKFRERPNAFRFADPPQGTFTGASVADYDRDGWLDIYFCLYAFYQGTGQYKYPTPYHEAENGPPNFLMRNNRDGTFRDVTAESGLNQNNTRYSFCCAWSDYNRDGWPDLYVVNDFGRKNLYRNNGDGTFTDIAPQAGVEDIGAGMSVSWLDYDNDGAEDLYIGNMWTSAGERISTQNIFKKNSPHDVRSLYQKHAMGNSLLRNRATTFENLTQQSGTGMGRWSWSSDSFDFDHDGLADLYIANGMVSGLSHQDLNSFFWRQVVAVSPDEARASKEYEQGWNAINELIRADGTWSGYERNVFYANNGDGTFSDVSAVIGLDFIEDGRSFALADFDHDGRVEIFLKNRNAPQLRILKNIVSDLPPSIAFHLEGTQSNRDAVGATVTIDTGAAQQTRMVAAGSGYLSQHSKEIFFGLGNAEHKIDAEIRWSSGFVQRLRDLPINHRVWVKEGSEPSRVEAFQKPSSRKFAAGDSSSEQESLPTIVETWLLSPFPAPDFRFLDLGGRNRTLSSLRGKPLLLTLSSVESPDDPPNLQTLGKFQARWEAAGLQILDVNVNQGTGYPATTFMLRKAGAPPMLRGSEDVAAIYNIVFSQVFDRHRDLILPTSFLIDAGGDIVKVYQGPINPEHVEKDFRSIPATDAGRLRRALPFPTAGHTLEFGRNYLSFGALFYQRGYLDQADASFQQALRGDPSSAEALYGVGSVYLNQNKNDAAREAFERTVKLQASYPDTLPDAWNNLGVIATREGRIDEAIQHFQKALQLNPHSLPALDNLGNAYRLQKRWDEAHRVLERALEFAPEDPEANYSIGMIYAQSNDTAKAYEYLQRALKVRPVYPEALNNLGVLYLLTQRKDEAIASFEQCIRVAPAFDQAYLNLARVYALDGMNDKARSLLLELLKQYPDHPQAKALLQQLGK